MQYLLALVGSPRCDPPQWTASLDRQLRGAWRARSSTMDVRRHRREHSGWEDEADWAESEAPPEVLPPRCPNCGGEVVYEFADIPGSRPEFQVKPQCERCGRVEVVENNANEILDLPGSAPCFPPPLDSEQRPRGLRLGDIPGAIRTQRAPPKPTTSYMDPPPSQATRPT